jgi:hypothetical protein
MFLCIRTQLNLAQGADSTRKRCERLQEKLRGHGIDDARFLSVVAYPAAWGDTG